MTPNPKPLTPAELALQLRMIARDYSIMDKYCIEPIMTSANYLDCLDEMETELRLILEWAKTEKAPLRPQEISSIERCLSKLSTLKGKTEE